jgi:hypothetical protein
MLAGNINCRTPATVPGHPDIEVFHNVRETAGGLKDKYIVQLCRKVGGDWEVLQTNTSIHSINVRCLRPYPGGALVREAIREFLAKEHLK